jgi:hypothetical protein
MVPKIKSGLLELSQLTKISAIIQLNLLSDH